MVLKYCLTIERCNFSFCIIIENRFPSWIKAQTATKKTKSCKSWFFNILKFSELKSLLHCPMIWLIFHQTSTSVSEKIFYIFRTIPNISRWKYSNIVNFGDFKMMNNVFQNWHNNDFCLEHKKYIQQIFQPKAKKWQV